MECNAQDCGISKAAKDTSILPSKIDQMKVSQETRSEANFGARRALMTSCLQMCPPKTAFFSFRMQPESRGAHGEKNTHKQSRGVTHCFY